MLMNDVLNYWFHSTQFQEAEPCQEANSSSASQEILRILWSASHYPLRCVIPVVCVTRWEGEGSSKQHN